MRYLLDTQILIWAALYPDQLPSDAKKAINDTANELYFSAASVWEVAIKNALQREDFRLDPYIMRRGLIENGYMELPISGIHAATAGELPSIHKDPFDRMLVAQAKAEGITLMTTDALIGKYPAPVVLVDKM